MQVLSKLAPLALLATTSALNPDSVAQPGDFEKCYHHDNQVPYAINKLCLNHYNLKVPGYRTSHGQKRGNIKIHVDPVCNQMGFGGEKPPAHLGTTMCKNRFLRLCASQGSLLPNVIRQDFGGRCGMKFIIEGVGGPRKPPPGKIKVGPGLGKPPKAHGPKRGGHKGHKKGKKKGHKGKGHKGKKKHHKKKDGKREEGEEVEEVEEVDGVDEVNDPAEIYNLLKASLEGTGPTIEADDFGSDDDGNLDDDADEEDVDDQDEDEE